MNVRIVFRHMEHSVAIENHVKKELEKVTKFLQKEDDLVTIDIVLDAARVHHHHKVEFRLNSKHYHLIATEEGPELYEQIDHVIKTMVHEIKKQKEKNLDKRNHPQTLKAHIKEEMNVEADEDVV